ncbi:SDR family NAD(P)-dependent oxidoreductase [Pseudorhodoferax sp.]|uniref:SDR family NAD(P)-dependent oxidoreductase n=1 Tax=Pseudorhodoferax sp. TaxID=1993553 RepID=UPI0039E3C830
MSESMGKPVAVVTGGAQGIGLAIGQWFLRNNYRVALLDRDTAALEEAASAMGPNADVLLLDRDVSRPEDVERAASAVRSTWGNVAALVNNAGVAIFKPVQQTSFADWREVMATNLDGAFLCCQAFSALMPSSRGGAIVNIASISGLRASTLRVAYGTSKAALIHLTRQLAVELGILGIRVNTVCPGPVETEMAKLVHSAAIRSDYYDAIPLGRYGGADEIADAVGFLCSPQASYVNGQFLSVDGGFDATGVGLPTLRRMQVA